jgi:Do/DeqQ family serine protease
MGSGVIISEDGYIITNNHVIENASTIEVTTNDNKTYNAELLGSDEVSDIAVLKIVGDESFPYVRFADSDQTKIGEWVLAVGNPFNLTSTVTAGIISAKSRDLNDFDSKNQSFIQTDAAVNSGNSGGALVNTNGDLIGINTAITSGTGGFVGYSFAVPSNVARKIFEDIIEFGNVQKGLLGVTGFGLNSKSADELNINLTEGFYVNDIEIEMGASKAGIIKGDVIISLDNIKIEKFSDLSGYLSTKRPGDKISVGIIRENKNIKLNVTLEKNKYVNFLGMQLKNMTDEELETYKITYGVKVSNLRNSSLYRMGIKQDYVLTEINNQQIKKTEDLSSFNSSMKINQMIFVSPNGEKERLIFE